MAVDHIFIFSANNGNEADELVEFGLLEGSNRIHPGQGTRNRKFYFENFFLEILWVYSETEIKNELTAPIQLWERANYQKSGCSPFGLCLAHTEDVDELFEGSIKYQPAYLPPGLAFNVITNEKDPYLPWTCRLPDLDPENYKISEPVHHPVGIRKLTMIKFTIPIDIEKNDFTAFFKSKPGISFEYAENYHLLLDFDDKRNNKVKSFNQLPLTISF